jgi:hypothetical protein
MQTVGLNRNVIDKYYTKPEIVHFCIEKIKDHIDISHKDIIIEPSAGNGSFIDPLLELSNECRFYDIEPENDRIIMQDYLVLDISAIKQIGKPIHIIGNPPFGRQSSIAIQFIKKSCLYADSISFILPKSFKKESMQKAFSLDFHLVYESDLPEKAFLVSGTEYNVETIFQIWVKRVEKRDPVLRIDPIGFQFVNYEEHPDISFRRVGVYAGKIDKNSIDKSIQSHYFIRFTNGKTIDENIERLKTLSFDHNNTVGPKSISKQELIKKMNELL